jgi:hypothetical protein
MKTVQIFFQLCLKPHEKMKTFTVQKVTQSPSFHSQKKHIHMCNLQYIQNKEKYLRDDAQL